MNFYCFGEVFKYSESEYNSFQENRIFLEISVAKVIYSHLLLKKRRFSNFLMNFNQLLRVT